MKYCILIILILFTNISFVEAHPGNTASDGCHYCRTNCDRWGVPWNQRHCHGSTTPKTYTPPVNNTSGNTKTVGTQQTYTSTSYSSSNSDDSAVLSSVAVLGGIGFLAYLFRKKK